MSDTKPTAMNIIICLYGDMNLVLETPIINATYLVSLHLLCSASPVFRAGLGPHSRFRESTELRRSNALHPDTLYEMPIGEELEFDPAAITVVLYVLHGVASHISENITFKNLLDIVIVCDYYDCAAAMSPWIKDRMQSLQELATKSGYEDWLFVAWVFRNERVFEQMTKTIIRNGAKTEDGEFGVVVDGEVKTMHNHLPECIIRDMAAQRAKVGDDILRWCRDIYRKYDDDTTVKCAKGVKYCDYIVFAALHKGLTALGLLRNKMDEHLDGGANCTLVRAVEDVLELIEEIRKRKIQIDGSYHADCITASVVPERLKAYLDNITCLSLTSYSKSLKPVKEPTWRTVVLENEGIRIRNMWPPETDGRDNISSKFVHMEIWISSYRMQLSMLNS
ncbi:hypothetical protein K440DRAFT_231192 [Wilcoxina mikolae CBS 423.85]|nr:hypothetical protein K440DRAFT_231192 [Wilcoxina mikolae CBS 423.85]